MRPPESLTGRLERLQNLSRTRNELLKRLDYRRPISERYRAGELSLHAHVDFTPIGQFCALYLPVRDSCEGSHRTLLDVNASHNGCAYHGPLPVLVRVRDVTESGKPEVIRSWVWLAPLNCCDIFLRESFEAGRDLTPEILFAILDKKLSALGFNACAEQGQIEDEVVESGAKIVNRFANENAEDARQCLDVGRIYADLVRLNIEMQGNVLLLGFPVDFTPAFNLRQMFPCPLYPEEAGSLRQSPGESRGERRTPGVPNGRGPTQ